MRVDAAIIGGGPAGATAGRLLAEWGHSVAILAAPPDPRRALAECLPPSNRKLFQYLGILDAIDAAAFYRTTGNTVWWGGGEQRVEPYPESYGYQVVRPALDHLLLELARAAGARVRSGKAVARDGPRIQFRGEEVQARFLVDCSGRSGVLARLMGARRSETRTIALCGVWRNAGGWQLPDASHTLVESYESGWAWSVPISASVRYAAFMGEGRRDYLAELARTRAFRRIFAGATLASPPWGRDAAVYSSRCFCGPGWLMAGDAAATIDPLSSFGVKKAMVSGWVAAVVANTCLRKPEMQSAALEFFAAREREVFESYRGMAEEWYAPRDETNPDTARTSACAARLKAASELRLRRAMPTLMRPAIEGREIVLREAVGGLDFVANVSVPRLVEIAEACTQVPDMYEAYGSRVGLPDFLTALATLVARGILTGI